MKIARMASDITQRWFFCLCPINPPFLLDLIDSSFLLEGWLSLYWRCERSKKNIQTKNQRLFHCYPSLVFTMSLILGVRGELFLPRKMALSSGNGTYPGMYWMVCFHASANVYNWFFWHPLPGGPARFPRLGTVPNRFWQACHARQLWLRYCS